MGYLTPPSWLFRILKSDTRAVRFPRMFLVALKALYTPIKFTTHPVYCLATAGGPTYVIKSPKMGRVARKWAYVALATPEIPESVDTNFHTRRLQIRNPNTAICNSGDNHA